MSPAELAAFHAGIAHAASMAQIAAVTIEARDDAGTIRQLAAAAALHGLADGLKASIRQDGEGTMAEGTHETRTPSRAKPSLDRHAAIAAGYTGDACPNCHAFAMKRSGTCLVCDACGSTTGCS